MRVLASLAARFVCCARPRACVRLLSTGVVKAARMATPAYKGLPCTDDGLAKAGSMLRAGQCVAFPTETVYGLGANALDEAAVLRVFTFKGRPLSDPLIVHVPDAAAALALLQLPEAGRRLFHTLAAAFWPGPLTIVGRAVPAIPLKVTAGTGFVGVRVPAHPIALRLLQAAAVPVAAPSANRFGHVSPTSAAHVIADLGQHPIGVLLGEGPEARSSSATSNSSSGDGAGVGGASSVATCAVGIESTVLKIDCESDDAPVRCVVYRRGGVSLDAISAALTAAGHGSGHGSGSGSIPLVVVSHHKPMPDASPVTDARSPAAAALVDAAAASSSSSSSADANGEGEGGITQGEVAPGQLLTHYAPDVTTRLVTGVRISTSAAGISGELPAPLNSTVIIDFGGLLSPLRSHALAYTDLSPTGSVIEARAAIFAALRWSESVAGAALVLLADPRVRATGSGVDHVEAVRDRMYRAASGREVVLVAAADGSAAAVVEESSCAE